MENFDVMSIDLEDYKCIIFSTSFETPLTYLDDINEKLIKCDLDGCKVVFDMLTHIGNNSDRFIEVNFDGKSLDVNTFRHIKISKKHGLRKASSNYFKNHLNILDDSILTSFQKKMLQKGISI